MYTHRVALVALLALVATNAGAQTVGIEHIDPHAKRNDSAAVIVPDAAPLVHTEQILVRSTATKDLASVAERLRIILKNAGSSVDRIVKINFVMTDNAQQAFLRSELARGTFGSGKPAVSFVTGKLPAGSACAIDVVALGTQQAAWQQVEHGDGFAVLPPGCRVYVSGQAVAGVNLAEATRKTLEELRGTLKFLGLKETSVVQLKAFLQPMAEHKMVHDEVARFFAAAQAKVPPLVLVEWQSSLPIEIELIAWGGRERAGVPIEFLTPPGMKASPVYSRVARINDGKIIYLSSITGTTADDPGAEIPEIFEQMGKVLKQAGSDYRHLAKATYYVTSAAATKKMGEIRPRYYDTKRPPAASLAVVAGTGTDRRSVTMDMIAVPSPRIRVNEYGPAERGHGLAEQQLREGAIALFDGESTFGWSEAKVDNGVLLAGALNMPMPNGTLQLDAAATGTLHWNTAKSIASIGTAAISGTAGKPRTIELTAGLRLRSLIFKPANAIDITPREIGTSWKAIDHPKLPKESQPVWSFKDGVVRVVGGPGCIEFQNRLFDDFVLQMEVRTTMQHTNGGVFFRSMPGSFMNGYEAQIYNRCQDGDVTRPWKWATGAIDDRQNARRLVSRDGEWFHYTIIAVGDRLGTWVNGRQTVDWRDERKEHDNPRLGKRTRAGTIQLQAHDAGTEVEFRNIRIATWK